MSQLKNASLIDTELRRFLNSLKDWIWEMDVNGIHTYTNNAVENILGYEPEELIGRHVSMFWPEESATPEKIEQFNIELKKGVPWKSYRGRFRHKNGEIKILESSGEPLYDEAGVLIGFRGMDRDIAQTLKQEKALNDSHEKYKILSEKLEWENNFKTLLLDIINHDIMNPVGVITGLSEMLKNDFPDNEMVRTINKSSLRLIDIMSNARALTQISTNDSIERQDINLSKMINSVLQEYDNAFSEKDIDVEVVVPEELLVSANPVIAEVFNNYISNIIKHADESQRVSVVAEKKDDFILVEFKDQGPTLADEVRSRVFDRGVRLDPSRNGSGLGLAIVKRIAEAHGAEVGVRPRLKGGNAFYINFPK